MNNKISTSYDDIYRQWRDVLDYLPTDRHVPAISSAMEQQIDTLIDVTQSLLLELTEDDDTHAHGQRVGEILHLARVMRAILTAADTIEEEQAQARICS